MQKLNVKYVIPAIQIWYWLHALRDPFSRLQLLERRSGCRTFSYKLGYCQKSPELKAFKEVSGAEATIVGFKSNTSDLKFEAFIMAFSEAPTGYVNPAIYQTSCVRMVPKSDFRVRSMFHVNIGQNSFVTIELSSVKKIN